jgi:hypothetical protein
MDALSSAVAMKINCDLQLTLMASSLDRLLAACIGNGYETVKEWGSSRLPGPETRATAGQTPGQPFTERAQRTR